MGFLPFDGISVDGFLISALLGVVSGILGNLLRYLWELIPKIGKNILINKLMAIILPALVGLLICFLVFGPQGAAIICLLVILWAVVGAQFTFISDGIKPAKEE